MEKIFFTIIQNVKSFSLPPSPSHTRRWGANEPVERQKRPLDPFLFVLAYRVHAKSGGNSHYFVFVFCCALKGSRACRLRPVRFCYYDSRDDGSMTVRKKEKSSNIIGTFADTSRTTYNGNITTLRAHTHTHIGCDL